MNRPHEMNEPERRDLECQHGIRHDEFCSGCQAVEQLQERLRSILTAFDRSFFASDSAAPCPVPDGIEVEVVLTGTQGELRWPDALATGGFRSRVWLSTSELDLDVWVESLFERYIRQPLRRTAKFSGPESQR